MQHAEWLLNSLPHCFFTSCDNRSFEEPNRFMELYPSPCLNMSREHRKLARVVCFLLDPRIYALRYDVNELW